MDALNPHLQPKMLKAGFRAPAVVTRQGTSPTCRLPSAQPAARGGCAATSASTTRIPPPGRSCPVTASIRRRRAMGEAVVGRGVTAAGPGLFPARPSCRRSSTSHASSVYRFYFKKNLQFCNDTQLGRVVLGEERHWWGGRCAHYTDARETRRKKGKTIRASRSEQRAKLPDLFQHHTRGTKPSSEIMAIPHAATPPLKGQ